MDSTESSARLDAALRQAATYAGSQKLRMDDDDMSMELAEDEITASFKPWATRSAVVALDNQENVDPFLPAGQPHSSLSQSDDNEDNNDMSMDITRAMGCIVPGSNAQSGSSDTDDMSMDLTMPLGSIHAMNSKDSGNRRKSLKRRTSLQDASQGSPAKRSASRRTSLRHRASLANDNAPVDEQTMEFTVAIGGIKSTTAPPQVASERRGSVDTSLGDETMNFTITVGSINPIAGSEYDNLK